MKIVLDVIVIGVLLGGYLWIAYLMGKDDRYR